MEKIVATTLNYRFFKKKKKKLFLNSDLAYWRQSTYKHYIVNDKNRHIM